MLLLHIDEVLLLAVSRDYYAFYDECWVILGYEEPDKTLTKNKQTKCTTNSDCYTTCNTDKFSPNYQKCVAAEWNDPQPIIACAVDYMNDRVKNFLRMQLGINAVRGTTDEIVEAIMRTADSDCTGLTAQSGACMIRINADVANCGQIYVDTIKAAIETRTIRAAVVATKEACLQMTSTQWWDIPSIEEDGPAGFCGVLGHAGSPSDPCALEEVQCDFISLDDLVLPEGMFTDAWQVEQLRFHEFPLATELGLEETCRAVNFWWMGAGDQHKCEELAALFGNYTNLEVSSARHLRFSNQQELKWSDETQSLEWDTVAIGNQEYCEMEKMCDNDWSFSMQMTQQECESQGEGEGGGEGEYCGLCFDDMCMDWTQRARCYASYQHPWDSLFDFTTDDSIDPEECASLGGFWMPPSGMSAMMHEYDGETACFDCCVLPAATEDTCFPAEYDKICPKDTFSWYDETGVLQSFTSRGHCENSLICYKTGVHTRAECMALKRAAHNSSEGLRRLYDESGNSNGNYDNDTMYITGFDDLGWNETWHNETGGPDPFPDWYGGEGMSHLFPKWIGKDSELWSGYFHPADDTSEGLCVEDMISPWYFS
jgi:hypothetical protein